MSGTTQITNNGSCPSRQGAFNNNGQLTSSSSSSSSLLNEYPEIMGETSARFKCHPFLGRGTSSVVYAGYHFGTNTLAAVKFIEEKFLRMDNGNLPMELKILQKCKCVNIIGLLDSYQIINHGLYLALERAEMTLHDAITRNGTNRIQVLSWCKETCDAVEYLHSRKIIHRDIKPSNILLVETNDNILVAKLSDFGLSKVLTGADLMDGTVTSGTWPYMAPEILNNLNQNFVATKAGDIFSLGVTMYYALSNGTHPFPANDDIAMRKLILDLTVLPKKLPAEYFADQDLLWKMLEKESGNRATIAEVRCHCLFWPWEKKRDYIVDVARSLESAEPSVPKVKEKMDNAYKNYYSEISSKKGKFNWLKLLDKRSHKNLLLSSKSRPDKEKSYGNYDFISQLIKLFRDKRMHPADLKTDAEGKNAFMVNGSFSEEKYTLYFLQLCPGFVEVVYSVVRDNPLSFTKDYYIKDSGSTSSLSTPVSQKKAVALFPVNQTGTATLIKGSSITIYEGNLISQNYFRGYSDCFLNPAAVYKISFAQRPHLKTAAEKWNVLASARQCTNYIVPILTIAESEDNLFIATKLAKTTLASELQVAIPIDCRNKIIEYLAQVVNGIACLHENMVVHGKIDQDHILMFGEGRKLAKLCVFTLDQPNDNEGFIRGMRNDIISFANLLQFSFSSSSSDAQCNGFHTHPSAYVPAKNYTWDHLVRWIRQSSSSVSPPTISQVACHPLFWDMQKSFHFISNFWRTLTVNGKSTLDEQYATFYKDREGVEFDWIANIDQRLIIPSLAKSGNLLSGLLCLISLAYNHKAIFKGEHSFMEYFNEKFPDLLIICFCAALSEGYLPEYYKNDLRQFLCQGQTKKEEVQLSEWMNIPPVFQNI